MHLIDEDRPAADFRRAPQPLPPMPFAPIRYEQHTAECAEDYEDPSLDGSLEMLGRVLIGAALIVTAIATAAIFPL